MFNSECHNAVIIFLQINLNLLPLDWVWQQKHRRVTTCTNKTNKKKSCILSNWIQNKFSGRLLPPSLSLKLASRAFILLPPF